MLSSQVYTVRSPLCILLSCAVPNTSSDFDMHSLHLLELQSTFCFTPCFFFLGFLLKKQKALFHPQWSNCFPIAGPSLCVWAAFHPAAHKAKQALHSLHSSEQHCANKNKLNDRWFVAI